MILLQSDHTSRISWEAWFFLAPENTLKSGFHLFKNMFVYVGFMMSKRHACNVPVFNCSKWQLKRHSDFLERKIDISYELCVIQAKIQISLFIHAVFGAYWYDIKKVQFKNVYNLNNKKKRFPYTTVCVVHFLLSCLHVHLKKTYLRACSK